MKTKKRLKIALYYEYDFPNTDFYRGEMEIKFKKFQKEIEALSNHKLIGIMIRQEVIEEKE